MTEGEIRWIALEAIGERYRRYRLPDAAAMAGSLGRYGQPPKDFAKWAKICVNIIRHYNEGWAKGFHHNIKYWEIKAHDSTLKVGGPAATSVETYRVDATHDRKRVGVEKSKAEDAVLQLKIPSWGLCLVRLSQAEK